MTASLQLQVLETLEGARNYNSWIADLAQPYLGDDPVEIGSGIGVSASLWLDAGLPRLTVTDADESSLDRLRERFAADRRVRVAPLDLLDAGEGDYSALVALNVLEHIADDREALRRAARLIRPGGRVVIFVPAFSFATGRFDRRIGHHRRYTVGSARDTMAAAGLKVEVARYVNAPGLVAWFVAIRLLRLTPSGGFPLRLWDRVAIPSIRRLERRWEPHVGQSVLIVGRKPGGAS